MRLFVACPECDRKYKMAAERLGQSFRCHCGHVLEIRESQSHEATVIRCSSCGGAREKGRNRCGYCQADFTIHERDLHTVCPKCLARVSDKAKFCPQCGTRLAGEQVVEDFSKLACPLCGPERLLSNRRLGEEQVSALECSMCAGLWLGSAAFVQLRERVLSESANQRSLEQGKPQPVQRRRHVGPTYRKCIYCNKLMNRRQYARGSGVLIDVCRDHGIWFDAFELQQILDWIARGGVHSNRLANQRSAQTSVTKTPVGQPPQMEMPLAETPVTDVPQRFDRGRDSQSHAPTPSSNDNATDLLGHVLHNLSSWFR